MDITGYILTKKIQKELSVWLPDWTYRCSIIVNNTANSSTLQDYQVLVTINTASLISTTKMRSDCGDIRFTDTDGKSLLPYWIEEGINTSATKIWVKIPIIPANSSKIIYMYYGNQDSVSKSNASAVFDFFDDFNGTTLNTEKWLLNRWPGSGSYSATVSGGYVRIYSGSSTAAGIVSRTGFSFPFVVEGKYRYVTDAENWHAIVQSSSGSASDWVRHGYYINTYYYQKATSGTGTTYQSFSRTKPTNWTRFKIHWGGNFSKYFENSTQVNTTTTQDRWSGGTNYIQFSTWNGGTSDYDWIAIRKYTSIEPIVTVGAEEITTYPTMIKHLLSWLARNDHVGYSIAKQIEFEDFQSVIPLVNGTFNQTIIEDNKLKLARYNPTTPLSIADNVYVSEGDASSNNEVNTNFGSSGQLRIADLSGYRKNTLVKLNLGSVNVPVLSCIFRMYFFLRGGSDNTFGARVLRISTNWNQNTVTWNTAPSLDTSTTYDQKIGTSVVISGWHDWNITTLVNHWILGTFPNYGFALQHQGNAGSNDYWYGYSTRYSDSNYRPYLIVVYPRYTSGSYISPDISISIDKIVQYSKIWWTGIIPENTSVVVETSISHDGGQSWSNWEVCTNQGSIPQLSAGTQTNTNTKLRVRLNLTTQSGPDLTPSIDNIEIIVAYNRTTITKRLLAWLATH